MSIPKFDPKELRVVSELPNFSGGTTPIFDFPVSMKEGEAAMYRREPIWQITTLEQRLFTPKANPDNIARAFVYDGTKMDPNDGGGKDIFGIEWEYVAQVGGSMVRPGKPFIEDAEEIADKVVWPDIDKWDWEANAKANEGYLTDEFFNMCWLMNGWYERLISFMDFEGAIMAVFDEDQKEAVKDFFDKLTDLYIRIVDKYLQYYPKIDGFCVHDDWGSQKETFFSPAVAEEMIVPYMRRLTDHIHSKGKYCDLHSCGQLYKQVPNMIAAGWDSWHGQPMNDTYKIYDDYGDKILVGVIPEGLEDQSEEGQRAAARKFAEKFCNPAKPCIINQNAPMSGLMTNYFREELYEISRKKFEK